jgi:hypothetical protein
MMGGNGLVATGVMSLPAAPFPRTHNLIRARTGQRM